MGNRKRFGCKKDIISVFFSRQNNFFRALTFSTHAPPCSSPSPKTRFISLQTFLISAFSFFISAPTYFTPGKTSESKLCRSGMSSATSLGTTVSYTLCIKIWPKEKTRTLNSTSLVARNGEKYMHIFWPPFLSLKQRWTKMTHSTRHYSDSLFRRPFSYLKRSSTDRTS